MIDPIPVSTVKDESWYCVMELSSKPFSVEVHLGGRFFQYDPSDVYKWRTDTGHAVDFDWELGTMCYGPVNISPSNVTSLFRSK